MTGSRQISFDRGTLLLSGDASLPPCSGKFWRWDSRVSAWRADAMHYSEVMEAEVGAISSDSVPAWHPVVWKKRELHPPRSHQQKAVAAWELAGKGIAVLPTGTGKTDLALQIMEKTAVSTLIVAPVRDLMYQWHRRILASLGYDAGVLGDSRRDVRPVTVTTYDSACIHMAELGNRFKLVIFDECHHLPGQVRGDAGRMCAAPLRLGLTATPDMAPERRARMEELIAPVCYEMPLSEAKGGVLADYDIVRIPVFLSTEEQDTYDRLGLVVREHVASRREDDPAFAWKQLYTDMARDPEARQALAAHRKRKSIEDRATEKLRVVEDLFRLHCGTPTIIFTGSNLMAREVSLRFLVPCLLQHCGKAERADILKGLEDGRYPAIVANQVLDEGVDVPAAKVAIILGGQASTRQAKQRLGRILRKSGTERAVLYEVVCKDTGEEGRSRKRRKTDAYERTRHRRV